MSTITLPGTGQNVAVDNPNDGSGVHQLVKLEFGSGESTNTRVSLTNPLPVAVAAGGNALAISPIGAADTVALPRLRTTPAATLVSPSSGAYAALDAVSDNTSPITFQVADQNDTPVMVLQGLVFVNDLGAVNKTFRLYIYNILPTADAADNATWTQTMAHGAGLVGTMTVNFNVPFSDGGWGVLTNESGVSVLCQPAAGTKVLYGLFQTIDGYTPAASGKTFTFTLQSQQCR